MELLPELPGQGKLLQSREQRVGIHLVTMDDIIIQLNGMLATDQTGRYPTVLHWGYQYIMVLYNYDSNIILEAPSKTRKHLDLVEAYDKMYKILISAGVVPVIQRLDNEVSKLLIESIKEKKLQYQLASPHNY